MACLAILRRPAPPGALRLIRVKVPAGELREYILNLEFLIGISRAQAGWISDLGPDVYSGWRSSAVGKMTERLERQLILELIGDVSGRRVLDIGCGDGDLAADLWQRGAKVVGIDVSDVMIAAAEGARQEA